MPAISNIVVADATPANHTFLPQQAALALSTWAAREAATFEGNPRLAVSMSNPSKVRPTSRIKINFTLPFERTVDGLISVPDTIIYTVEAVVPAACSDAEALKGFTMLKNLVAHTVIQSYLASREPTW